MKANHSFMLGHQMILNMKYLGAIRVNSSILREGTFMFGPMDSEESQGT